MHRTRRSSRRPAGCFGGRIEAKDKRVDLEPGREKLVFFSQTVGLDTALNFQDHPGYFDSTNCKTKAAIL